MSLRSSSWIVVVGLLTACASAPAEGDESGDSTQALGKNDPCAVVRCAAGTHCVRHGKSAACEADPVDPCAAVLCAVGTTCESVGGKARCVPTASECQTDADCHLEDNY